MTDVYAVIRGCASKNRYATESVAKLVAEDAWRKRQHVLRVYLCADCGGWHLTKRDAERPTGNFRPARKSARQQARERNRTRDERKQRIR